MKNIFYICLFLLLAVCVQAQRTVTYVSFFPPRDVTHDTVTLTQDQYDSFRMTHLDGSETPTWMGEGANYAELPGGLILGAANESIVSIDSALVTTYDTVLPYAIRVFRAHNNMFVKANGQIKHVSIGGDNDVDCGTGVGQIPCNTASISAYDIKWPLLTYSFPDPNVEFTIRSAGKATLGNLTLGNAEGFYTQDKYYNKFIPTDVPVYPTSLITNITTRTMTSSDTMEWRRLRIEGTEKCLLYLTLNPPVLPPNYALDGGECQEPEEVNYGGGGGPSSF